MWIGSVQFLSFFLFSFFKYLASPLSNTVCQTWQIRTGLSCVGYHLTRLLSSRHRKSRKLAQCVVGSSKNARILQGTACESKLCHRRVLSIHLLRSRMMFRAVDVGACRTIASHFFSKVSKWLHSCIRPSPLGTSVRSFLTYSSRGIGPTRTRECLWLTIYLSWFWSSCIFKYPAMRTISNLCRSDVIVISGN